MANIVITSTTNSIKVDFGDYYPENVQFQRGTWQKSFVESIQLDDTIKVHILDEVSWVVSYDGSAGSFQIDSVDGVAPSSNLDLYNKLTALIA